MNKQTIKICSLVLVLAASSSVGFRQNVWERYLGYRRGMDGQGEICLRKA